MPEIALFWPSHLIACVPGVNILVLIIVLQSLAGTPCLVGKCCLEASSHLIADHLCVYLGLGFCLVFLSLIDHLPCLLGSSQSLLPLRLLRLS